ncbi:MAG TPA: ABC-2 family transporter protein [Clostridia bacterium]|nr:ABC-2 family transporter protein [Clostridia bacterium]
MLTEVRQHLKLIWKFLKFNLSASMEYRASFITQIIGMMVNNLSFIFFWWIIFKQTNSIAGYGFKDVMFLWSLAPACFGFAFIVFGNIRNLGNIIMKGELDAFLLQPKDVYINVLCSRTNISAWGDFGYGIILYIITFGFHPLRFLEFLIFTLLGGLLMGSVFATAETLTFFIGNSSFISNTVFEFIISFTLYPETIFKGWAKWVIYTLLPAGFIVFIPLKIFFGFNPVMLLVLAAVDIVYVLFGYMLFRKGLKRYESGNMMTTKL